MKPFNSVEQLRRFVGLESPGARMLEEMVRSASAAATLHSSAGLGASQILSAEEKYEWVHRELERTAATFDTLRSWGLNAASYDSRLADVTRTAETLDTALRSSGILDHRPELAHPLHETFGPAARVLEATNSLRAGAESAAWYKSSVADVTGTAETIDSALRKSGMFNRGPELPIGVACTALEATGFFHQAAESATWYKSAVADITRTAETLDSAMRASGILDYRPELARRLAEPFGAASAFLAVTAAHVSTLEPAKKREVEWLASTFQRGLADTNRAVVQLAALPSDFRRVSPRELRAPFLQLRSVIESGGSSRESRVLSETAEFGVKLSQLVVACNEARKAKGLKEIFKPTSRMIVAIGRLWLLEADSLESFGQIVDDLFFVLYESAGTDQPRFLQEGGGPMADVDCEVIWALKHLRVWIGHDMDHGSNADQVRKWQQLNRDLNWLGPGGLPHSRDEFRELQRSLFRRAVEFLEALHGKIRF